MANNCSMAGLANGKMRVGGKVDAVCRDWRAAISDASKKPGAKRFFEASLIEHRLSQSHDAAAVFSRHCPQEGADVGAFEEEADGVDAHVVLPLAGAVPIIFELFA